MAEYIEREALLQALEALGGCDAPPDSWADGWDKGISEAIIIVKKMPTADVSEVVRCKNCIPLCNELAGVLMKKIFAVAKQMDGGKQDE